MRILHNTFLLTVLLFSLLVVPTSTVVAQSNKVVTSSQQAGKLAKQKFGGKVLKVNSNHKQSIYTVKVLQNNGHVIVVNVDAYSGQLSKR